MHDCFVCDFLTACWETLHEVLMIRTKWSTPLMHTWAAAITSYQKWLCHALIWFQNLRSKLKNVLLEAAKHKCDLCQHDYKSKRNLERHFGSYKHLQNSGILEPEQFKKSVECPGCEKIISVAQYRAHVKACKGIFLTVCRKCKQQFVDTDTLIGHVPSCHTFYPVVCVRCECKFPDSLTLESHMCTLPTAQRYNCVECNAKFAKYAQLQKHWCVVGTCKNCQKPFSNRLSLKRHEENARCSMNTE